MCAVQAAGKLVDLAIESLQAAETLGLAPHAPFTASLDLYRRCQEIAAQTSLLVTTHLAESREEMSMFRDATGPLYDFMKEIGRDMRDCGGANAACAFIAADSFGRALAGCASERA